MPPDHQYFTSVLEEFQLEQLAVDTFPVEVSFSLSFLLASSSAAATSMVWSEPALRTEEKPVIVILLLQ